MTLHAFNDSWYHGIINRYMPDDKDKNASVAAAILVGCAMLSQAVDGLAKEVEKLRETYEAKE